MARTPTARLWTWSVAALVVDAWRQPATEQIGRAMATAERVLRVAVSMSVWPIQIDLDPRGAARRLRAGVARRPATPDRDHAADHGVGHGAQYGVRAIYAAAAALLVFHPVLWAIYLFDATREQRELAAISGTWCGRAGGG